VKSVGAQPLRYGFVGTGNRGQNLIEIAERANGVQVVALCDSAPESMETALSLCASPEQVRAYPDYHDLFADPDVDAVFITTPNHTHVSIIEQAVLQDKHIFLEKPIAHRPEDARRIAELAKGFAPIFWVGLQYRYMPAIAQLRREIQSGTCGSVTMLTIREHRGPFLHKVGSWNRFSDLSGGTLVEKCCHFFDLFNLIAGAKPLRVYASGGMDANYKNETYKRGRPDILDNAFVTVDYENGVRAMLELCMFHPAAQTHPHMVMTAIGDQGYVEATNPTDDVESANPPYKVVVETFETQSAQTTFIQDPPMTADGHSGADERLHAAFADCIRTGTVPEVTADSGAWAVYVGTAAERSVQQRRVVELCEVIPS
jgi:myo-inositol 2-dehydrogenase / D-chiro-inositol 1-dehydrogenase